MDLQSVITVFSVLFGMVIGSFLNVCVYRIPRKASIVHPPSSCPACGERIRFYDNIPVLSYLILSGRCRSCRARIPLHYPIMEGLTGLFSLLLFTRYGLSIQYFLYFAFVAVLLTISFIDLHHKIIPDVLSLPGIALGWISSLFWPHITWLESLLGIVAGGGILWIVAWTYERLSGRQGMGGGDVKLLAMIGAWMGWRALPLVLLVSSLTGVVLGGAALLISGKGYRVQIPFGPFLSLGAMIYFFFGSRLVSWYAQMVW